jgi:hypothetical protein
LQLAVALRNHGTCAHLQFFELIESHHAFTPHKLVNHRFSFPKTIVQGRMEAGRNSVIYMGLILGPNKTDEICGKTMVTGTMHRGSAVYKL